jgi:superfamily II RNA helicase
MVKICSQSYPKSSEEKYQKYFQMYPFPLSSFQKFALEAIVEGNHILVTAHTGSGKTLPAEFAIEYFVKTHQKKVIYTSPIKALSNQKFYEFTKKFPDISFGILTGDIKTNPEADVLIMTTEILQNTLYKKRSAVQNAGTTESVATYNTDFQMDFDTELACVVFDEVHYINDPDRGKVWEETIMLLPAHIQMVMLSATIDAPHKFAAWCEGRGGVVGQNNECPKKEVYLTTTYERVVPLTHYSYITTNQSIFKIVKDKEVQEEIKAVTNKLFTIQSAKGEFNETHYFRMKKTLDLLENKNVRINRSHVINNVLRHCVENEMLPALCFVFSRKMLEVCAKEVTTNLLEFDSKVPYTVARECEQIIRRLPNYKEYLELPEYLFMVSLLEKGVAIHHAGVMPVLREMVELLYAKGYIKVLFATETFAVGINMPTKTVIFTDVNKFDGSAPRILYSHEYTQMAGRAGRRGIDTVGNVIHLNNIFRNVDSTNYKMMMKGTPQTLTSKFKVSFSLLLNMIEIEETDFEKEDGTTIQFIKRSMAQQDIDAKLGTVYTNMSAADAKIQTTMDKVNQYSRTPYPIIEEYLTLLEKRPFSVNKGRKDIDRKLAKIRDEYKFVENDKEQVKNIQTTIKEQKALKEEYSAIEKSMSTNVNIVLDILREEGFITAEQQPKLTSKGSIATCLREIHCLPFANFIASGRLTNLTTQQLISLFSCFTNITVSDQLKAVTPYSNDKPFMEFMLDFSKEYQRYEDLEVKRCIQTGMDYSIHYDLMNYVDKWCETSSAEECKQFLQMLSQEKEIFLGEFVKALLKVNNISTEMERVAEMRGDMEFLKKLKEIPVLTMKYVVTNQSLYV